MQNRLLLLKILTLMLYAGPLLAGLSGQGWNVLPAFAAIFVLWQVVMRPADWPRDAARWREGPVVVGALARAALMLVLVTVMFGIGRGIGGVAGHLPAIPAGATLALSFVSIPLSRMIWNPAKAAEMDAFLDDALRQVQGLNASIEDPATAAAAIGPLLMLPDDAPDATARAGAQDILTQGSTPLRMRALTERLGAAPGAHIAARRGVILWATDRKVAERYIGTALQADAFMAAQGDTALEGLFAENALPLLVAEPELYWDFPSTHLVVQAAALPDAPRSLRALAEAMEEIARRNDSSGDGDGRTDGDGDGD
jgi:hypothetical protein